VRGYERLGIWDYGKFLLYGLWMSNSMDIKPSLIIWVFAIFFYLKGLIGFKKEFEK